MLTSSGHSHQPHRHEALVSTISQLVPLSVRPIRHSLGLIYWGPFPSLGMTGENWPQLSGGSYLWDYPGLTPYDPDSTPPPSHQLRWTHKASFQVPDTIITTCFLINNINYYNAQFPLQNLITCKTLMIV